VPGVFAALRLGLVLAVVGLAACSHAADTSAPSRLAGMRLGDPPSAGLTPVNVPLPAQLAGKLAYFTRPGRTEPFHGVALTDPIYAFYGQRLFAVSADLAEADAVGRLHRDLEAGFGPPLCQETATGRSCLWRLGAVDLVLTRTPAGKARLLLRSTRLAEDVRLWREQAVPLEGGEDADR